MGFVVQIRSYNPYLAEIDEEIQGCIGFKYWMVIGSLELCHQLGDVHHSSYINAHLPKE